MGVDGVMKGRVDATNRGILRIDPVSGALEIIDFPHDMIHDSLHFTYTEVDADLDTDGTLEILITVPDTTKWPHMLFIIDGQLQTLVEIFHTCTHVAGAVKTAFNNNLNSAVANTTILNANGGTGADGTRFFVSHFGIDTGGGVNKVAGGGQSRSESEWLLIQNKKHLLKVTSKTDNNIVSVKLGWYERTPAYSF